jgi:hypothetical protein
MIPQLNINSLSLLAAAAEVKTQGRSQKNRMDEERVPEVGIVWSAYNVPSPFAVQENLVAETTAKVAAAEDNNPTTRSEIVQFLLKNKGPDGEWLWWGDQQVIAKSMRVANSTVCKTFKEATQTKWPKQSKAQFLKLLKSDNVLFKEFFLMANEAGVKFEDTMERFDQKIVRLLSEYLESQKIA